VFDTGPDDKVSVNDRDDFVIWWFGAGVNGDGRDLRGSGGGGGGGGREFCPKYWFSVSKERTFFAQKSFRVGTKRSFRALKTCGLSRPAGSFSRWGVLGYRWGRFYGFA